MINQLKKEVNRGLIIAKTAWVRILNYRFTTLMYRIGEVAETLVLILMWTAIYSGGSGMIKGFSLNEMITYFLIGSLCSVAVRNFLPSFVSRDISEGRLSMFLVKPIPYVKYVFFNEFGRAALAMITSVCSQILVITFFLDKIILNTDSTYISIMIVMVFLAFIIEWLIGFLVGTIAFWTDEVEGMQATIDRIKKFFSGGYFPISLLPTSIAFVGSYLPFAYSFYIPALIYLKKISIHEALWGIAVQIVWILVLSLILGIVWKKGLKKYEASGA